MRPGGIRQQFSTMKRGSYLESVKEIPEPHSFVARVRLGSEEHSVVFQEHEHPGWTTLMRMRLKRDSRCQQFTLQLLGPA